MFKLIFISTLKYLFLIVPLMFIGYVILPFILLFVPRDKEELPRIFRWFDNFSGPEKDGLAGDWPYRVEKGLGKKVLLSDLTFAEVLDLGDATNYYWADATYIQTAGYWKLWWRRYVWLAWRNPVDYFKGAVLGKKNEDICDLPLCGPHEYYKYFLWSKKFALRIRIGYKTQMGDLIYTSTHAANKDIIYARFEFDFNPFYSRDKLDG